MGINLTFFYGYVLFFLLNLLPLGAENFRIQMLEDFSIPEGWSLHYRKDSRGNLLFSKNETPAKPDSGKYLQVQYEGEHYSGFRLLKDKPIFLEGCTFQISIDIFGFGDSMEFYADFRDQRNKFIRIPAGIQKHQGWKTVNIPLTGIRMRRFQMNAGRDGITLEGFYIKKGRSHGKLRFLLDDLISKSVPCTMEAKKNTQ